MDGALLYNVNGGTAIAVFAIVRILPIPYFYMRMVQSWDDLVR